MSKLTADENIQARLRQIAENRIRGGTAPQTQGWTISAASLTLLHRLASDPTTASDAVKMLHELQVHQIELDLQHEHMQEERLALELAAQRMAELYEFAPVAYFTLQSTGQILEGNLVGARMLGVEQDEVSNHHFNTLIAPVSRPAVLALLEQVLNSGQRHSCRAQAVDTTKSGWLEVIASADTGGQHCLVVAFDIGDINRTDLQAEV